MCRLSLIPSRIFCFVGMGAVAFSASGQEDLSPIQDSRTREAVALIQEKLADVIDYSCQAEFAGIMVMGKPGKQRTVEYFSRGEVKFKRPNLGHQNIETVKHPAASWMDGQVSETYYDGTYWWQHIQPAADSGEKLADLRKMPAGFDRNLYVERQNMPRIYRYVLWPFVIAGIRDMDRDSADVMFTPFEHCDLETLTIDREDDDVWVFTAKPRRVYPQRDAYKTVRVVVGKADGILRETFYDGGEKENRTVTISNVKLNPGFEDAVFQFTPPEGIEVTTDGTEKMVKSFLSQRESWEEKYSSAGTK